MKRFITNLALFIVLAIAFSSFNACKGTQETATNNSNAVDAPANTTANTNTVKTDSKASDYPPLVSGIAEAPIELLDGTTTKVSDHKGTVILLNLWGIWCGPCRDEMPHLAQLQAAYGERGFRVMGLNIGDHDGGPEEFAAIKAFGEKMKLNYSLGRISNASTGEFYKLSRQEAVPQSVLVDRDGRLRGLFLGGGAKVIASMTQTVDKVMAE
ncbi:MAG TPA: TlpA disulfide reductase family protein [Pyrinomonadaceae bacterium]|nr:TlpA disulfide reductase family protein [Pyrinomonadaceae bacterium]